MKEKYHSTVGFDFVRNPLNAGEVLDKYASRLWLWSCKENVSRREK